ncbi:MAG: hypothetical protein ABL876_10770 [Chitinophagaceae bacterium]
MSFLRAGVQLFSQHYCVVMTTFETLTRQALRQKPAGMFDIPFFPLTFR